MAKDALDERETIGQHLHPFTFLCPHVTLCVRRILGVDAKQKGKQPEMQDMSHRTSDDIAPMPTRSNVPLDAYSAGTLLTLSQLKSQARSNSNGIPLSSYVPMYPLNGHAMTGSHHTEELRRQQMSTESELDGTTNEGDLDKQNHDRKILKIPSKQRNQSSSPDRSRRLTHGNDKQPARSSSAQPPVNPPKPGQKQARPSSAQPRQSKQQSTNGVSGAPAVKKSANKERLFALSRPTHFGMPFQNSGRLPASEWRDVAYHLAGFVEER
eukprot:3187493-Rhodomonas_salina.1